MTWTDTTFHLEIFLTFGQRLALQQEGEMSVSSQSRVAAAFACSASPAARSAPRFFLVLREVTLLRVTRRARREERRVRR
jgi:hypothetical protein